MDKLKDECLRSYLAEKKINIDYFMKMAGVIAVSYTHLTLPTTPYV